MNWTEGSLARHSRRKGWDKDAARQKEYFAKARARKQQEAASGKPAPRAPFVPDYIIASPRQPGDNSAGFTYRKKDKTPRKRLMQNQNDTNERSPSTSRPQLGQPGLSSLLDPTTWASQQQPDVDLEAKRRKLLKEKDWSSIRFQKPIEPRYPQQRAAPYSHLASRGNLRFSGNHHHANALLQIPGLDSRLNERPQASRQGNDMQIRIGDQNLRWSLESNSVRSSVPRHIPRGDLETWYSPPPGSQLSHSPSESRPSACRRSATSDYFEPEPRPQSELPDLATAIGRSLESRRGKERSSASHDRAIVVTSSPPVIHHPRPTREGHSFDVHSLESQDNDSVIAGAGSTKQSSSRSASDDIQWNAWLNETPESGPQSSTPMPRAPCSFSRPTRGWDGSKDRSQTRDSLYHGAVRRHNGRKSDESSLPSSPHPNRLFSSDGPSGHTNSTMAELESPQQVRPIREQEGQEEVEEAWATFGRGNGQSYESSKSHPKPGSTSTLTIHEGLPSTSNPQNLMELLVAKEGRQEKEHRPREATRETLPHDEDEDEIWKKFIFDDYAEISRRARDEVHEQTKCDLGLKRAMPPCHLSRSTSGTKDGQIREIRKTTTEPSSTSYPDLSWVAKSLSSAVEPSPAPGTDMNLPIPQPPETTADSYLAPALELDTSMLELSSAYELGLSICIPGLSNNVVESPSASKPDSSLQTAEVPGDAIEPPSVSEEWQPGASITHATTEEPVEEPSCGEKDMQAPLDAAVETNTVDANSTAPRPGSPRQANTEFKFHHPSLFVGRLASNGSANVPCGPPPAVSKMGRRPKARGRRGHGRPDFRMMPDYDGDPIEECHEG